MLRLNVRDVTRRLTRVNSDGLIVLGGSDTKRFVANWQAMGEVKKLKLDKLSDDLVGDTIIWGSYPGHVSLTVAIILILCLVAVVVYVVILLYKKQEITAPTLCMKRSIRSEISVESPATVSHVTQTGDATATVSLPDAWRSAPVDEN